MIIIADLVTLLAGPGPTMRSLYRSEPWSIQSVVRIGGPLIARPTCQSPEILFAALICCQKEVILIVHLPSARMRFWSCEHPVCSLVGRFSESLSPIRVQPESALS